MKALCLSAARRPFGVGSSHNVATNLNGDFYRSCCPIAPRQYPTNEFAAAVDVDAGGMIKWFDEACCCCCLCNWNRSSGSVDRLLVRWCYCC